MKTKSIAAALLAAATCLPVLAQPPAPRHEQPGLVHPLTRAGVEAKVQARFARFDANRDGFVTRDEIQARRAVAPAPRQASPGGRRAALFARLDANGDGVLTRDEFEAPRAGLREGGPGPRGPRFGRRGLGAGAGGRLFAAADANGDGRVSLQEARSRALQRFDQVDVNRDGTVTPDERRDARRAFRGQRRG